MGKFTHYLVTRFNVPFTGHAPEFFSGETRSQDWLKQRIRLFADYCVPAVAGQSNLAFTWLIYLDPETERSDIIRIRAAIPANLRVEFRYVDDYSLLLEDLRSYCNASGTAYVITSRLDNDDALGIDFIDRVQSAFEPEDRVLINFLGGVYYDPVRRLATHHRHKVNNSFTSLIERISPGASPLTVLGFPHLEPPPSVQVLNVPYAFAFWINLHGTNAGSRQPHGWPLFRRTAVAHFAFSPGLVRISLPATLAYTIRWAPRAFIRKSAFRIRQVLHGKG